MDNPIPPVAPVSPVPLAPPVLPPVKGKSWLKVLLIVIGILVILGLFGNLYLLARNQKPVAEVTPTPTPVAATTTPDPTANWKIYTKSSKNFGSFSIKYPEDWLLVEKQTEDPRREQIITMISRADYKIEINAFMDGWGPSGCNFDKTIKNQPQISDYDSYVDINNPSIELKRALPPAKAQNTLVWTICAKEGAYNSFSSAFPFSGTITYFTPPSFNEIIIKEMDQILSTFQFLDQNQADATANWETYNNAGISFKYPSDWVYEKFDISGRAEHHGVVQLKPENYQFDIPFMPLFIHYWDNLKGLTIEQYDKKINQGAAMLYPLYNSQSQTVTLGGLAARYESKGDCSPFPCHKYVVSAQNKIWEISSQYTNDPNEFKSIFDQILSTFKFLQ